MLLLLLLAGWLVVVADGSVREVKYLLPTTAD